VLNVFQFGVIVLDHLAQTAHRLNADIRITGQAFKERFNALAVEFLKAMFAEALTMTVPGGAQILPLLSAFSEVNLLDSTTVTLPETLKKEFPGCGGAGAQAAAKLYLVLNYLTGGYQQMRIEAGRKADQDMGEKFLAGHRAGALWLFDLGFFNAPFLAQIARAASFFVCRLAASQTVFYCRRAAGELEPFDLDLFLRRAPRRLFEIEVVFGPKQEVSARLIIAPVPKEVAAQRRRKVREKARTNGRQPTQKTLHRCDWTLLLTNTSAQQLPTTTVLEVYRVRWQVELAFKLFKSEAKLESTRGYEKHRIQCEFYAKLIALLLFNRLSGVAESLAGEKVSSAKLWRRMRDEVSDLRLVLGQGTAPALREMLLFLLRYAKPRPSTRPRLAEVAKQARQVTLKDPLGKPGKKRRTNAETTKAFTRPLKSHKVTLNSEQLGIQRTVSLP
jgi:IS4 transposase